jgi:hypothetical protein
LAVLKAHNSGQVDVLEDPSIFREGSAMYLDGERAGSPDGHGSDGSVGPEAGGPNGSIALENSASLQFSVEGSESLDRAFGSTGATGAYREPPRDVSAADSTFSAAVDPSAYNKFLPNNSSIAIEEEKSLCSDDTSNDPNMFKLAKAVDIIGESSDGSSKIAVTSELPAGSAYSFVKSTKESKEKDGPNSAESNKSTLYGKTSDFTEIGFQKNSIYECVVRNQKMNVQIIETGGSMKISVTDTEGALVGEFPIVPALYKQLKDVDDEGIKNALSDIVTNYINPSSTSASEISANNKCSNADIKQRPKYLSLVNDAEFESEIVENGANKLQIVSRNLVSGEVKTITLLPVLAVQVPNLDDHQINGIITDILKSTFIG